MSLRRISTIGAAASTPSIVEFGLRFLRTVVLSRLLLPEEFGTTVAIGALYATVKLSSDLAIDKFVVVRAEDEDAAVLAAAHAVAIGRGAVLAALLFGLGGPIAGFLDAPGAAGSFRLLGLVLLINAFPHLHIKRMQVEYRYVPELIAFSASQLTGFLVVFPFLFWFGDHRVIVGSFLTEAVVFTVASHLLARLPYSVRGSRPMVAEALRFGFPLVLSGIGLAATGQLDRILVAHWLSVVTLARYGLIVTIGLVPISPLLRISLALVLPFLANRQHATAEAREAEVMVGWAFALLAGAYALWVAASLDLLVPLFFGRAWGVDPQTHVLVTAVATIRILQNAPTVSMLARGQTGRLAIARLASAAGLAVSLALLLTAPGLWAVLIGVLVGDVLVLALLLMQSGSGGHHRLALLGPMIGSVAIALLAVAPIWLWPDAMWKSREFILAVALPLWLVLAGFGYRRCREALPGRGARRGRAYGPP